MRDVRDVQFHIGGKAYVFEPYALKRGDMALLLPLFMALTQPRGTFDVAGYVDELSLGHCFSEVL